MISKEQKAKGGLARRSSRRRLSRLRLARNGAQVAVALFLLYTGWQFHQFVQHFATFGEAPYVARPDSVDAFLPLSALVSLKAWLATGVFDTVHPAALIVFLTILSTSLLLRKPFCSWVCPVGAISEALARFGRWGFGRNLQMPALLDWPLRGIKYLLLLFFVSAILVGMSGTDALRFLQSPYNMVADVKMLQFFIAPGSGVMAFLLGIAVLSVFFSNFWCRYLCPYGALLGLASLLSPLAVQRDRDKCTGCGLCTAACPNRIEVARVTRVISPECSGCLECVEACPRRGALGVALPRGKRFASPWVLPALLLAAFLTASVVAQLTGHWESGIDYQEYARLIPIAGEFSH